MRISAPPMEWPIRKTGTGGEMGADEEEEEDGEGRTLVRTEVMSSRTSDVGPVRPRSHGCVTERPQPRWSKACVWMPCAARVGKRV